MNQETQSDVAGDLTGQRILVVEAEPILAQDMTRLLEEAGAKVIGPALGAAPALELLANRPAIDAAMLGEKDSWMVRHVLRRRFIPFLVTNGYDLPRLLKSLKPARLVACLVGLCTRRSVSTPKLDGPPLTGSKLSLDPVLFAPGVQ